MTRLSDLTPCELEILQPVILGKTNKAIASEIELSEKTLEFHIDPIYTRIGARTRLLRGLWALQHGREAEIGDLAS
jgi:DNA-binding NarL/FixJ family response regulator